MLKVLLVLLLSTPLFSCGTLDTWINAYNGKGIQGDKNKKMSLVGIYECGRYHYHKNRHDKALLAVLHDALLNIDTIDTIRHTGFADRKGQYKRNGRARVLLERIFRRYNALDGAIHEKTYDDVAQALGDTSCFPSRAMKLKVEVETTANIRNRPKGKKIGFVKNGTLLKCISYKGEWAKVSMSGNPRDDDRIEVGYIHTSLVSPVKVTP